MDGSRAGAGERDSALRRVVLAVALLNAGYGVLEVAVAWSIGSVALFADAVDFFEDALLNGLVLWAMGRHARVQASVALLLAAVILVPGIAALWTGVQKFLAPVPPDPVLLTATGFGALLVNAGCALLLARIRAAGGSLLSAAYLSARNDVIGNVAIIAAGGLTAATLSAWPDLVVGLGLAALHADAAREVYHKARSELGQARP